MVFNRGVSFTVNLAEFQSIQKKKHLEILCNCVKCLNIKITVFAHLLLNGVHSEILEWKTSNGFTIAQWKCLIHFILPFETKLHEISNQVGYRFSNDCFWIFYSVKLWIRFLHCSILIWSSWEIDVWFQ